MKKSKLTIAISALAGVAVALGAVALYVYSPAVRASVGGVINVSGVLRGLTAPTQSNDAATQGWVLTQITAASAGVTFVGYTSATTGALGGLSGANAKCSSAYSGSHWASVDEIMKAGSSYPWSQQVWVRDGMVTHFATGGTYLISPREGIAGFTPVSNDPGGYSCQGWVRGDSGTSATTLQVAGGTVVVSLCNNTFALACVK